MIEYGVKVKFGILPDPDDIEADPILLHNIVNSMNDEEWKSLILQALTALFAASMSRTAD